MSEVLTGAETKKALECCTKFHHDCFKCPSYIGKGTVGCVDRVKKGALDLINRYEARIKELEGKVVIQQGLIDSQKAEIERLTHNLEAMAQTMPNMAKAERAEAVKEFSEKFLKKVHDNHYVLEDAINSKDHGMFTVGIEQAVNETKKEMVGES